MKRLNYGLEQIYQPAIECEHAVQLLCLTFFVFDTNGR